MIVAVERRDQLAKAISMVLQVRSSVDLLPAGGACQLDELMFWHCPADCDSEWPASCRA